MSTVPPNKTSHCEDEECPFLYGQVWQRRYLTDSTYRNLVAITSINSVAVFPTIILNALVIKAVATRSRLQTPSNRLLASMAGTDLFSGLVVQPIAIAVQVKRILGDGPFCTLETVYAVLGVAAVLTSFSHLVLISIDRYIAIKKPLRYRHIVTKKRIQTGVVLAWVLTVLLLIPAGPVLSVIDSETEIHLAYSKVMNMILSIVCFLYIVIIGYTYGYIYSESRRQKKRLKNQPLSHEETEQIKKDNKAVNTLTIILGAVLLTYLPSIITGAVSSSSERSLEPRVMAVVWSWANTVVVLNSLFNPLIYCWRFKNLRHAFLEMLHYFTRARKPPTKNRDGSNTTSSTSSSSYHWRYLFHPFCEK